MARERPNSKHEAGGASFFRWAFLQMLLAGILVVVALIGFFVPAKEGPVVGMTVGIVCTVLAVACVIWGIISYIGAVKYVALYDDRVVWRDGSGEHEADWDDITDVWRTEIKVNGQMNTQQVIIKTSRRKTATFTFILSNWRRMADTIQEETAMRLGPEMRDEFLAGDKVRFGPNVAISQSGLVMNGTTYDWDDINRTTIRNGYLVVIGRGRKGEQAVALGETPNFMILLKLLEETTASPE